MTTRRFVGPVLLSAAIALGGCGDEPTTDQRENCLVRAFEEHIEFFEDGEPYINSRKALTSFDECVDSARQTNAGPGP